MIQKTDVAESLRLLGEAMNVAAAKFSQAMEAFRSIADIRDVPCGSCVEGYGSFHTCDASDYCPCDGKGGHA